MGVVASNAVFGLIGGVTSPARQVASRWGWGQRVFGMRSPGTTAQDGPVPLALARRQDGQEEWWGGSAEPPDWPTGEGSGVRFDSAENFLDEKSHGFQLESSLIRSAKALARLCLVLASTTRYLVAPGTEVINQGKRRWVDAHGFRGQRDLKIGWNWVNLALRRGDELVTRWQGSAEADPEPARASKR